MIEDLLKEPVRYSFFQAVRLLRLHIDPSSDCESFFRERLRVRPDLSFGFPGTDIVSIEEEESSDAESLYRMTVSFLGLYGASSPLPSFYTEDLLRESSEDRSVTRDFLDIFNSPFYRISFRIWTKYRWWLKLIDENAAQYLERLFSLIGIGIEGFKDSLPEAHHLLRYIGLFTQFPRSALGLRTLLSDALGIPCVQVVPCVPCKVQIPLEQRCHLGSQACSLGEDLHIGPEIDDAMGKIRIVIGPVDSDVFHSLLPGGALFDEIASLTRAYLFQPMEIEVELILKREAIRTACLGEGDWAAIGYSMWMFSGESVEEDASVVFQIRMGDGCS